MSERELHIPRLGHVNVADGFRIVAAMNPFDAVGTARISAAVYDRMCRVAMGYQDAGEEVTIAAREAGVPGGELAANVVEVVRLTRSHPDVRVGSSVRGAIDTLLLAEELSALRNSGSAESLLDAALAALSGRIHVHEGSGRSPEDVVTEIFHKVFRNVDAEPDDSGSGDGLGKRTTPIGATAD